MKQSVASLLGTSFIYTGLQVLIKRYRNKNDGIIKMLIQQIVYILANYYCAIGYYCFVNLFVAHSRRRASFTVYNTDWLGITI